MDTWLMDFEEQTEEEDDDENTDVVRAKWTCDGAETLTEAAQKLRDYADYLERLAEQGWEIEGTIRGDYGFIRRSPR